MGYEEEAGGVEGWTDWQTSYVHLMMGNDRKYNDLRHRIVRGALDRTLYNAPGGQRPTSDEAIYQAVAKLFAKYFRSVRDMAKKEFDEELQDTINERGEFEARQIEGKKPEPSEHGRTGDILNEAMDLIRSDMGSGPLPEWREPNWLEMAEWEVEEEKLQRRSAEAAERLTRQPGEEPELPSDMVEGLGRMGIKGSKEQTMKKNLKDAGFNKIGFVLKGQIFARKFATPVIARKFVMAAADKWGEDFRLIAGDAEGPYGIWETPRIAEPGLFDAPQQGHWVNRGGAGPDSTWEPEVAQRTAERLAIENPNKSYEVRHLPRELAKGFGTTAGFNFSPSYIQSQVLQSFPEYQGLQHDDVDFPNADFGNETNHPMLNAETSGDMYTTAALESAFDNLTKLSYVSTSPAGAAIGGIDSKPQVLEGAPLLKEDQLRKPSEMDEFYTQYTQGPRLGSAYEALEKMAAFTGNEKEQFGTFLKRVMAEVAATFIAAYKVTNTPPLNKIPGTGTLQLDQVEQAQNQSMSTFNIVDNGSRVKHLVEKLTDSDIQEAINDAWAQAAVWCSSPGGGFVYEVFCRAESLDSESMALKYKFVTGLRDSAA